MAMLGQAALAMWWDMTPDMRAEFEHWHSHEHFPERLALPGFLRASRWAAAQGEGFFVLYELASHAVLSSPEYLARLNDPTPWSRQLMPHHRHMVRCQCEVVRSRGAVTARHALTLRSAALAGAGDPEPGVAERFDEIAAQPGIVGAHLLKTNTPRIGPTTEQAIRGHTDSEAGWILVFCGHDAGALQALLPQCPAGWAAGLHGLSLAALPADVARG